MFRMTDETIKKEPPKEIGIIGAGWYGTHISLYLQQKGYVVTIFDKNNSPFEGISGKFGVRNHTGQHYPRSAETRESCRRGHNRFNETYPELVNEHEHSIYALGIEDADHKPSKVTQSVFESVCYESSSCQKLTASDSGYDQVQTVMDIPEESSLVLGTRLRQYFITKLTQAEIHTEYNFRVTKITPNGDKFKVLGTKPTEDLSAMIQVAFLFDRVINATSFKEHIPRNLPLNIGVVYQVCLALVYKKLMPQEKPFSFIVMDGLYPCLMPYDIRLTTESRVDKYIVTHAKYTNVMTSKNVAEAELFLEQQVPSLIDQVKLHAENEMLRFWPEFNVNFEYVGYTGSVLAKPETEKEFRSAITFEASGVIHIIPGKVNNIFEVSEECEELINQVAPIVAEGEFRYLQGGVLDSGKRELQEPLSGDRNTCQLQTHKELEAETDLAPLPCSNIYHGGLSKIGEFSSRATQLVRSTSDSVLTATIGVF